MYLTYDEYIDLGGEMEESTFTRYEFGASKVIDSITANRVSKMKEVPLAVKMCIMELLVQESILAGATENIAAKLSDTTGTGLISSFSTDGYQESYSNGSGNTGEYIKTMVGNINTAQIRTIRKYLVNEYDDEGVPLLYRGVF